MDHTWNRGETYIHVGISLNDWALPLHVSANQPYTTVATPTKPERWKSEVMIMVFCFYVGIEW